MHRVRCRCAQFSVHMRLWHQYEACNQPRRCGELMKMRDRRRVAAPYTSFAPHANLIEGKKQRKQIESKESNICDLFYTCICLAHSATLHEIWSSKLDNLSSRRYVLYSSMSRERSQTGKVSGRSLSWWFWGLSIAYSTRIIVFFTCLCSIEMDVSLTGQLLVLAGLCLETSVQYILKRLGLGRMSTYAFNRPLLYQCFYRNFDNVLCGLWHHRSSNGSAVIRYHC